MTCNGLNKKKIQKIENSLSLAKVTYATRVKNTQICKHALNEAESSSISSVVDKCNYFTLTLPDTTHAF